VVPVKRKEILVLPGVASSMLIQEGILTWPCRSYIIACTAGHSHVESATVPTFDDVRTGYLQENHATASFRFVLKACIRIILTLSTKGGNFQHTTLDLAGCGDMAMLSLAWHIGVDSAVNKSR
jgi:hypothetical protein